MKNHIQIEDILPDKENDEDLVEVPLADKVFRMFFVLVTISFVAMSFQFAHLALGNESFFKRRAAANMSDTKIQPAPRGIIVDRFGKPLLRNEPISRIFVAPHDFPEEPEERVRILKDIGEKLGISWSELKDLIEQKDWGQSDRVLIVQEASHDQIVAIGAADIAGVYVEPSFKRVPEFPFEFSHVLGYTGLVSAADIERNVDLSVDDEIGKAGLEAQYDEYLRGKNGKEIFYRDAFGKVTERRSAQEPSPGMMIETTIDRDLQRFMYRRLKEALVSLGRDVGVAVAMDPRNGEVLGLVNIPSFDIGRVVDYLRAPLDPLFNRAVSGLYNPGSAIKPVVGVAVLSEGVVTPDSRIFSAGYIEVPNPYDPSRPGRFLDWRPNGWVNLREALAKSSNIFFYETTGGFEGQRGIGIDSLKRWWQTFMFDLKTKIDLPGERQGLLPDPAWKESVKKDQWRIGDTYNVSIGQGDLLVTPISLLNSISAIANGGVLYVPHIMREIRSGEEVVRKNSPETLADIREKIRDALPSVRDGMEDVVRKDYGTAHSLSALPFSVAAKTGTAQIQNNAKVNAFFVGYAPAEDPQIAILVLVENAREGSLNTIPVANDIFLWYYENRLKK